MLSTSFTSLCHMCSKSIACYACTAVACFLQKSLSFSLPLVAIHAQRLTAVGSHQSHGSTLQPLCASISFPLALGLSPSWHCYIPQPSLCLQWQRDTSSQMPASPSFCWAAPFVTFLCSSIPPKFWGMTSLSEPVAPGLPSSSSSSPCPALV